MRPTVEDVNFYADVECTVQLNGEGATANEPGNLCSGYNTDEGDIVGCHNALDGKASTAWRPQLDDCGEALCWLAINFSVATKVRCASADGLGKVSESESDAQPDAGIRLQASNDLNAWAEVARSTESTAVVYRDNAEAAGTWHAMRCTTPRHADASHCTCGTLQVCA